MMIVSLGDMGRQQRDVRAPLNVCRLPPDAAALPAAAALFAPAAFVVVAGALFA